MNFKKNVGIAYKIKNDFLTSLTWIPAFARKTIPRTTALQLMFSIILCLTTGCARKNPHFFVFENKATEPSINPIALPTIKKVTLTQNQTHHALSWQPVPEKAYKTIDAELEFIGYNLYRFTPHSFIPPKPLNEQPIQEAFFKDEINKKHPKKIYCYMIKPVFTNHDATVEGPGSRIVQTPNSNR